jgi:hypothetical protein
MHHHACRSGFILALLTSVGACASGDASRDNVTIADSAGIRIVESSAPAWTESTAWRVDPEPRLTIGAVEGDEAYLLHTVMGLTRLSDGTIVAANMGTSDLRFYDAQGRHFRSVGRAGQGPGEFGQIMGMQPIRGDTLMVAEGIGQWSAFTPAGEFVRRITPEPMRVDRTIARAGTVLHDGTFIARGWPQGNQPRTDVWTDSAPLFHLDREGKSPRPIAQLAAVTFVGNGTRGSHLEFGPGFAFAVGPDHFFHTFPSSYDIERYDMNGNLQASYRRAWTPQPVTQEMISKYHDQFVNAPSEGGGTSPEWRAFREQRFSEMTFAETLPAHGAIRIDRTGHLWVQHVEQHDYTEAGRSGFGAVPIQPSHFSIFDPDGVWLGDIETPGRFRIIEIGEDYLLGITRDELAVEYIRMYRLHRD